MRTITGIVSSASVMALIAATAALAQSAPASTSPAASEEPDTLETVIVTARKMTERAIDVPTSMSVISGGKMIETGASGFTDLLSSVPGLQFTKGIGTGSPVIRGITDASDNSPTTAIIVDGAPFGTSSKLASGGANTLNLDPLDVQRIEVLKGPQGTLYGANTIGGLLNYTLVEPNLQQVEGIAQGAVRFTEYGSPSYLTRGAISVPVIENKAAVRLSGYFDHDGGFIDNDLTHSKDINWGQNWGAHLGLALQPIEALQINVHGFFQNYYAADGDFVPYQTANQTVPTYGDLRYNEYLPFSTFKNIAAGLVNINYDLGFANLTSITSIQDFYINIHINGAHSALTPLVVGLTPAFGGPAFPAPGLLEVGVFGGSKKVTQEVRLSSQGNGPLSWIIGGYYAREKTRGNIPVYGVTTAGVPIPSVTPAIYWDLPSTLEEYSGFGNLTWHIMPTFELTGGIRVGGIGQSYNQFFFGTSAAAYNAMLAFFGASTIPANTGTRRSFDTVLTYLATATWHFSDDGMVYARYATGYRPGGPNFVAGFLKPTFDPDETANYEVGLKTRFLGGRGEIELAGFYTDWTDMQIGVSSGGITGFGNGGDAQILGVEGQITYRVTPELTVASTFNYSDGQITKAGGTLLKGYRLVQLPLYSGSVSVEYRTPVSEDWEAYGNAGAFYNGKRWGWPNGNPKLADYTLIDLHAGISSPHYSVDLSVRNLLDTRAQLTAYEGYGNLAQVARPRTYGMSLTYRP